MFGLTVLSLTLALCSPTFAQLWQTLLGTDGGAQLQGRGAFGTDGGAQLQGRSAFATDGGAQLQADMVSNVMSNEDEWEPMYRIYGGTGWDSHDDYLSQERTALHGDEDDSQFRSYKLDQWRHNKIFKVKVEIYDDGDEVAEFEFDAENENDTSFFSFRQLRHSSFTDLPDGLSGGRFVGDDFSFDGDGNSRHWAVSNRHVGDCNTDDGWFQVLDKPKAGRNMCVCGYENVEKHPAIMYAKNGRKTRWSNRNNVGYADMMMVSVSHVPYPAPPPPAQPTRQIQQTFQAQPMQLHFEI